MNPSGSRELVAGLIAASPFHAALGIDLDEVSVEEQRVRIGLRYRDLHQREPASGRHHGGVIAALVDVAGTFAAIATIGRNAPTTSLSIDFLRPPTPSSDLIAVGQVRHAGRTVGRADVDVTDMAGRLVAIGRVRLAWSPADA
ncbi:MULTISPECIES: PaaI family thioesterase [unclassified Sphingomonas]|uniref:PaaI family thioesterase n=1 Tax=unclassified Sphingomonas TaxID=196159 RepID=UPI000700D5E2|nr:MULTISPECIES: PaaI family thioesterase [unclassified Sphingomonas]KQX18556.1 hypothetical protein ASD17_15530 [Sphingomonas sp. Root1294]KQY72120.1 hypothetical protein ASD39_19445 [Sphingomonas sp. Root50]KRB94610.1 hypothetical protein ASE22_01310 [Sphingomonas sp. Root720]